MIDTVKKFTLTNKFNRPEELVDKEKELPTKRQKKSHPIVTFSDE